MRRYGPVRAKGEAGAPVEQGAERVRRLDALGTDPLLRPSAVIDRVVGLHRCHDAAGGEPGDVSPPEVLGMLDPEAPVAGAVGLADAVEDVEQHTVGPLANRVNGYLQPRRVGRADPDPSESSGVTNSPDVLGASLYGW